MLVTVPLIVALNLAPVPLKLGVEIVPAGVLVPVKRVLVPVNSGVEEVAVIFVRTSTPVTVVRAPASHEKVNTSLLTFILNDGKVPVFTTAVTNCVVGDTVIVGVLIVPSGVYVEAPLPPKITTVSVEP